MATICNSRARFDSVVIQGLFVVGSRRLGEKIFDQPAIVFFFDSSEQSGAELSDGGGFIERQAVVHLSAAEVTWHALRFEDWLQLSVKINPGFRN